MAGPISPSTEGPNFGPPQLPPGWIAQWDSASRKYYYVQLATGVSQWDIPTEAAKTGSTPAQREDPYGAPPPELITHPDGSQTVKHADGTMEPIMPDGSRGGPDGPTGDRGLGTMAMNAILGGKNKQGGGGGGGSLGSLANQFLSGGGGGGGGKNSGIGGKLVGQLASNLFSPSDKPEAPSNYHGGQNTNASQQHGGLAGSFMGSVAHMFGGESSSGGNFGYSGAGTDVTYQGGEAPTYKPPGSNHNIKPTSAAPTPNQSAQSHSNNNNSHSGQGTPSHSTPSHSQGYSQQPPSGYSASDYSQQSSHGSSQHGGHQSYGSSQHSQPDNYGSSQHGGQQYNSHSGGGGGGGGYPGGYPGQSSYGGHGGQSGYPGGGGGGGGGYQNHGYGQGGRY